MSDSDKSKQESQTAEAFDDIGYVLTFGNSVLAPDKTIGLLELWQSEQINFQDNANKYSLTLHGVKFNRKIYQPGEILAELDIIIDQQTVPSLKSIADLFAQRMVKMDQFQFVTVNNKKGKKDRHCVASNYYVYEVNPQLVHGSSGLKIYVKLSIYSVDKVMTLNKYSKTYVNKKLGSGILMPESRNFHYHYGTKGLIKTDIGHMCFLKYPENLVISLKKPNAEDDEDAKKYTATVNAEFIHPYLVQYNESFYDFLSRTSNRCGEFLFFEDGKLTLGLPDSEPVKIDEFASVTYQEVLGGPLEIPGYARDSVKDGVGKVEELNQTPIAKSPAKYPMDVFAGSTAYNNELAIDEYIFPLEKEKFSTTNYEMRCDGTASQVAMAQLIPFFRDFLTNETAGGAGIGTALAKNIILQQGVNRGLAWNRQRTTNPEKEKLFLTPYAQKPEHSDGTVTVQFGTLSDKGWTTLDYFNDVRSHQEEQQRQTICIDLGTNATHYKLGQKIKVKGCEGEYVIIEIRKRSGQNWNNDYGKYDQTASDKVSGVRSQIIYAIPAYKGKDGKDTFIPPVNGLPIICKAGPQTAFIIDNADPKQQGRVRIAYPWQSVANAQRAALLTAQQRLKQIEKEEEELEAQLEKLSFIFKLVGYGMSYTETGYHPDWLRTSVKKKYDEYLKKHNRQTEALAQYGGTPAGQEELRKSIVPKESAWYEEVLKMLDECCEIAKRRDAAKEAGDKEEQIRLNKEIIGLPHVYKQEYYKTKRRLEETRDKKEEQKATVVQEAEKVQKAIADDASPWIRVSSPMATPGGGAFFKPQVGDEVLINYDNDNIDRPYVVGGLFSKNNPVPQEGLARYTQPLVQQKDVNVALMSPNGHHITFTDPEYGGNFFTNALSPGIGFYSSIIGLDKFGKNVKDMSGGIHIGDRYGLYEIEMLSHKRSVNIKSPFGTVGINAFSGITICAPNGDVTIRGKNITLEAGNKISVTSGKNIQPPGIGSPDTTSGWWANTLTSTVGAIAGGAVDALVAPVVDLSLIRHVVEVFVRPVDGTMLIKSKRFLRLEAGAGKTTIKRNRYAKSVEEKKQSSEAFYNTLIQCVQDIDSQVQNIFDTYNKMWRDAYDRKRAYFDDIAGVLNDDNDPNIAELAYKLSSEVPVIGEKIDDSVVEKIESKFEGHFKDGDFTSYPRTMFKSYTDESTGKKKKEKVLTSNRPEFYAQKAIPYLAACIDLYQYKDSLENGLVSPELPDDHPFIWVADKVESVEKCLEDEFKKWDDNFSEGAEKFLTGYKPNPDDDPFAMENCKGIKRRLIMQYLQDVANAGSNKLGTFSAKYIYVGNLTDVIKDPEALKSDYTWKSQVLVLDRYFQNSFFRTLWDSTIGKIWNKLKENFRSFELDVWKDAADGQILFSDKENATMTFENGGLVQYDDPYVGSMDHLKKILMAIK